MGDGARAATCAAGAARSGAGSARACFSKSVIVWGWPLSVMTKSDLSRPRAGFPFASVTKTWMSFSVTVTSCCEGRLGRLGFHLGERWETAGPAQREQGEDRKRRQRQETTVGLSSAQHAHPRILSL